MDKTIINELNTLLKGEQIAVEAYERFIQNLKDESIKREFLDIQQNHRNNVGYLAQRIQTLGGKPEYSTGFAGIMASAKIEMQNMRDNSTIEILKQAFNGEDQGIANAEEIVKGDLDKASAELVDEILSKDHDTLKKVDGIMNNFEQKH